MNISELIDGMPYSVQSTVLMVSLFLNMILIGGPIYAFIIMIIVRVKYPQNIFGKVLMFLYIIGVILLVGYIVFYIVNCVNGIINYQGCGALG